MDSIDKPFILTGDFNVVHQELDIWNPSNIRLAKLPGTLKHERDMFNNYLDYHDTIDGLKIYKVDNFLKKQYSNYDKHKERAGSDT